MTSIFENTHSKVTVHILHDDTLTDDNRRKFLRTAEKYSQCVEFHDVSDMMKNVSGDVISLTINKWPPGSLFRLFIPEIIALDRVIYLDCDILVNMDIKELWSIDIEGNIIAGVPGYLHGLPDRVRKGLAEIDYKGYVNSGVLIMDLRQMRQKGSLSEMSAEWFSRHRHLATLPDQDALNSIFRGHIKTISGKYNFSDLDEDLSGFIVHTWRHKSWMGLAGFKSDALYWKMFLRSAWGENVTMDELVDIFNGAALKSRYKKITLIKRAVRYMQKKILWWSPVRLLKFLGKEAIYRVKYAFKHC